MERMKKPRRPPPSSAALPPWVELPRELAANILLRLGVIGMLDAAPLVCTTWRSVIKDPAMWRVVDLKLGNFIEAEEWDEVATYIYKAYCLAVKRSQGELQEINIEYFGADELLRLISDRSNKLRRLRIVRCSYISGEALCKAVKSLPELEELHLLYMTSICPKEIEAIGLSCPKLKTFTFNEQGLTHPVKNNKLAFAVAKSMPNLRHLRLFANGMTNKGLQAVLDGCPKLEYLDIRQCFNVVFEGELGERCLMQVKNVRRPSDSFLDYEVVAVIIDNEPFDLAYLEEGQSNSETDSDESDASDHDNH